MKRVTFLLMLAALCAPALRADERSERLLAGVNDRLKAMGRYAVAFEIAVGDIVEKGRYEVDGSDFFLTTDEVDVYAAAGVRHEVHKPQREVVIDRMDMSGNDILSNPATALTLLPQSSTSESVRRGKATVITLTPKDNPADNTRVRVRIPDSTQLPDEIVYIAGTDSVTVRLLGVERLDRAIERFSAERYKGFERIDFRKGAK